MELNNNVELNCKFIQTDCGPWPDVLNGYPIDRDMVNIGIGIDPLVTSRTYVCNYPYVYTLEESFVKCTDNGSYSTAIGECVKGELLIIWYICY